MKDGISAGAAYSGLTFLAGFLLGTLRELVVAPAVGSDRAILVEVPAMILVSFLAARWTLRHFPVPAGSRLVMAAVALALLIAAEEALTRIMRGQSLAALWSGFGELALAANLAGLAMFFAMPFLVRRR